MRLCAASLPLAVGKNALDLAQHSNHRIRAEGSAREQAISSIAGDGAKATAAAGAPSEVGHAGGGAAVDGLGGSKTTATAAPPGAGGGSSAGGDGAGPDDDEAYYRDLAQREQRLYYRVVLQLLLKQRYALLFQQSMAGMLRVKWRKRHATLPFEDYARDAIIEGHAAMQTRGSSSAGRSTLLYVHDEEEFLTAARGVWAGAAARDARAKLAVFVALRTAIAPAVEALVLLDRKQYIDEESCCVTGSHNYYGGGGGGGSGSVCKLVTLFDPRLSPRNIAVVATRM